MNSLAVIGMVVAVVVCTVVGVELIVGRASRRRDSYGRAEPAPGTEALIVLGYPSTRGGGVHPVQRWRCEIAVRSRDANREGVVVFTGGARQGQRSEAEAMAACARDALGLPADEIRVEDRSRSTWENINFALAMVEDAEVIKIVSDPLHAARGRAYVREVRPDLAERLAPADDHRPLERWWIKVATLAATARFVRVAVRPKVPWQEQAADREAGGG